MAKEARKYTGLTLMRRLDEGVVLTLPGGERITVGVTKIEGKQVKLTFGAPPEVTIHRDEVQDRVDSKG